MLFSLIVSHFYQMLESVVGDLAFAIMLVMFIATVALIADFFFSFQPLSREKQNLMFGLRAFSLARRDLTKQSSVELSYLRSYLDKRFPALDTLILFPAIRLSAQEIAESIMLTTYLNGINIDRYLRVMYVLSFPAFIILVNLIPWIIASGDLFFLFLPIFLLTLFYPALKYGCVILSLTGVENKTIDERKYRRLVTPLIIWSGLSVADSLLKFFLQQSFFL